MNQEKKCITCGTLIKGRSDKRFCDDYCRSNFNNQVKARIIQNPTIKTINKALQKNRKIIETLLGDSSDPVRVSKEKLLFLGFHFGFITHLQNSCMGEITYCCYDYGYLALQDNDYLLSRMNCGDLISIVAN